MSTVPARQSNRDSLIMMSIDVDLVCLSVWRCTPPVGRQATDLSENKTELQQHPLRRDVVTTEASPQGCVWHRSCKQVAECQSLTWLFNISKRNLSLSASGFWWGWFSCWAQTFENIAPGTYSAPKITEISTGQSLCLRHQAGMGLNPSAEI